MAGKLSDLTRRARTLRQNMTDAERALWRRLRSGQLHGTRFRRQAVIGRFIVDFACFDPRIVVELDGGQHGEQLAYDAERTRWLTAEGFVVLRFWNNEVLSNLEGVVATIADSVSVAGRHRDPPP